LSDASTAGGAAPSAGAAPAEGQQPAADADFLEIDHEFEPGKPTKIKVPRSKVAPDIAKWRADLDRRASKLDLDGKGLTERSSKLEQVLQAAKSDPEAALRALGIDPEQFSEAQIAKKVRALMQADEESKDPSKKASREQQEKLEKLEKDAAQREKDDAQRSRQQMVDGTARFVEGIAQKFPEAYRQDARLDVIAVLRAQLQSGKEPKDIKGDDLLAAATKLAIARRDRAVGLKFDVPAQVAKVIQHPASAPRNGGPAKPAAKATPGAGDYLMGILNGFPKRR